VAHAGAQGDRSARVYALALEPTQLRIATTIAAGAERTGAPVPEEAFLDGDRIAIVAAGEIPRLQPTAEKV
jgi:septum site-determining protein MinC